MNDALSLKWIDGNDAITVEDSTTHKSAIIHISGYTETPTFNVDDPSMFGPLSVLSGLASGFCERRAVLNSIFVTGVTNGASSTLDWTNGAVARATIVSNCMNNLALGIPVDSLFYSGTTAALRLPGSANVSNYMTTMDSAITTLITGETEHYIALNGSDFSPLQAGAFDAVAIKATETANVQVDTVSSISQPVSDGGANLKSVFLPCLPVEWAKERKWMLDEIRYTAGGESIEYGLEVKAVIRVGSDTPGSNISSETSGNALTFNSVYTEKRDQAIQALNNVTVMSTADIGYVDNGVCEMSRTYSSYWEYDPSIGDSVEIPYQIITVTTPVLLSPYSIERPVNYSYDDTNPLCSFYIDAPYREKGAGSSVSATDLTSVRMDRATKLPAGNRVIKLNYGTKESFVVSSGAVVTFIPDLTDVVLSNCDLTSCKFSQAISPTPGDYGEYIDNIPLSSGTLTAFNIMGQGAYDQEILLTSNCTILHARVSSTSGATGLYDLDSCSIRIPQTSMASYLPAPSLGFVSTYSPLYLSGYPYYIPTLHVLSGGVAKIAPRCIKGNVLNVCDGATIEFVDDTGTTSAVSISIGGAVTVPSGNKLMPNPFLHYMYNNTPLVGLGTESYEANKYTRPLLIAGSGADATTAYTLLYESGSVWPGHQTLTGCLIATNYSTQQLYKFTSSFGGTGNFGAVVLIPNGITLTMDQPVGSGFDPCFVIGNKGTLSQTKKSIIGNGINSVIEVLSGGTYSMIADVSGLDRGVGISVINRPAGKITITSETYEPSVIYLMNGSQEFTRDYTSSYEHDSVVVLGDLEETRYAWTSGTGNNLSRIWTNRYDPTYSSPVYTDVTNTTADGYVSATHIILFDPFALYEGFGNDVGYKTIQFYSGCSVAAAVADISIESGRTILNVNNYTVQYDEAVSCTLTGPYASMVKTARTKSTSDYDVVFSNCSMLVSGSSVGVLNKGFGYNIGSGTFISEGGKVTVSNVTVIGGTMTLNAGIGLTDETGYVAFNPLALKDCGVSQGWNSKTATLYESTYTDEYGDLVSSSSMVYIAASSAGEGQAAFNPQTVASCLSGSTVSFGGIVLINGGSTSDISEQMDTGAAYIRQGFSCYNMDVANATDHYHEFNVRQFPTSEEIAEAKRIYSSSLNQ